MAELMTETDPTATSPEPGRREQLSRHAQWVRDAVGTQNLSLLLALLVLAIVIRTQTDKLLLSSNLVNLAQSIVVVGIVAVVSAAVIVSGGLDLSVGSVAGLSAVVAALVTEHTAAMLGILTAVVVGLVVGLINGLIITVLRINAVIATLATLSAVRGIAFLVAPDGKPVGVLDADFTKLGTGRLNLGFEPGIPYSVFLLAAVVVAMHLLLRSTATGRSVYAIGGNERAARLAGVRVMRLRLLVYGLSGAAAGLAGVIIASQTFSGAPDAAPDLLFDVITACFLGGCALEGGRGTVVGVLLAVVLLGVLDNGMSLLGIATFYQLVAKGLLLVFAVGVQQWRAHRAQRMVVSA